MILSRPFRFAPSKVRRCVGSRSPPIVGECPDAFDDAAVAPLEGLLGDENFDKVADLRPAAEQRFPGGWRSALPRHSRDLDPIPLLSLLSLRSRTSYGTRASIRETPALPQDASRTCRSSAAEKTAPDAPEASTTSSGLH